jgi:hypothetical protein
MSKTDTERAVPTLGASYISAPFARGAAELYHARTGEPVYVVRTLAHGMAYSTPDYPASFHVQSSPVVPEWSSVIATYGGF